MRIRVISLFLLIAICSSCEYFNLNNKSNQQAIDTIVNFTTVDVSPTFKVCKDLIDKEANTNCFRESIYKYISENLSEATIKATQKINETIYVTIAIDNKGKPSVSKITATESMYTVIPKIDSLIVVSLQRLPKLYPAIKRGIPVATQYQIPIQIRVK